MCRGWVYFIKYESVCVVVLSMPRKIYETKQDPGREQKIPTSKLIESSDDEEIPATPKQPTRTSKPGRKRVKRQVDKTYVDDQG